MAEQRVNDGTVEALASPSRERVYSDFSQDIDIDPVSREVWIHGYWCCSVAISRK